MTRKAQPKWLKSLKVGDKVGIQRVYSRQTLYSTGIVKSLPTDNIVGCFGVKEQETSFITVFETTGYRAEPPAYRTDKLVPLNATFRANIKHSENLQLIKEALARKPLSKIKAQKIVDLLKGKKVRP